MRPLLGLALAVLALAPARAEAFEPLQPLARPGPWSGVSGLIGYGERLWFANSVKFADHNSADVYSYDPVTGRSRYERHLFSQDAGVPAVAGGLLYWPFEDARFSAGRGEYMVTNGRAWRWRVLPQGQVFHIHAMAAHGGALFAATSAWRGGLQRSDDGGVTWRVLYDHPTPSGFVSRLTALAVLDSTLYVGLTAFDQDGATLLRLVGDALAPVPGWPRGRAVSALRAFRGWLYGVTAMARRSAVWRTDGRAVEPVVGLDGVPVRALAAGPDALWAVSAREGGGTLWRSADGVSWTPVQRWEDAEPLDVAVYASRVYVGTVGPGGRGTLWGPPAPAPTQPPARPVPLLPTSRRLTSADVPEALATLDRALGDPSSYAANGRRLGGPFPDGTVSAFGGALRAPAAQMGRWYLLRALALSGHGRVPPALLAAPWAAPPNRAEKYFEPAPVAAWAVGELGQADPETLAALVSRLGAPGHPLWLDGDFVGALTALTGERFGYDGAAWRAWWARQGSGPLKIPGGIGRLGATIVPRSGRAGGDPGRPGEGVR